MNYEMGKTYIVKGDDGVERVGVYVGREQGAGVEFDVFETEDRIPFQPGLVVVYQPVEK
jgi:hypothetical protein